MATDRADLLGQERREEPLDVLDLGQREPIEAIQLARPEWLEVSRKGLAPDSSPTPCPHTTPRPRITKGPMFSIVTPQLARSAGKSHQSE
ncbi:MAG: hypothetical protein K8H88_16285 [Sandaracinaceae bacterium]|nr:hypothetical protein [Sandaracinaceae bacterium]